MNNTTDSTPQALAVAPRSAPKRFALLLHLYSFQGIGDNKWLGIWETIGVKNLNTDHPRWTLLLRVAWKGCRPLGTVEEVPEMVIDYFGHLVDRAALRGVPNGSHEPCPQKTKE